MGEAGEVRNDVTKCDIVCWALVLDYSRLIPLGHDASRGRTSRHLWEVLVCSDSAGTSGIVRSALDVIRTAIPAID